MKKQIKKQRKKAFLQDWGTYSNQTLVCVGMNREEIASYLRRIKAKEEFILHFLDKTNAFDKHIEDNSDNMPRVFYDEEKTILSFENWKNDWEHLDGLNHEIAHLIHHIIGRLKNMMNEDEGRAYQHEYLFQKIRRKLWKMYPHD